MLKRAAAPAAFIALAIAPTAAQADALDARRPEYRFDRAERWFPKRVYGREAGGWLQYWTYYAYNGQDRGVIGTGRHEGDWELVQIRVDGGEGVYAQHAWAERCAISRPVVYVANGSHAAYFTRGVHDRPWPDPNDYARGDGRRLRPPVVRITRASPSWMRKSTPWGRSRASWVPGEQSSPLGPAFQHDRFDHPAAWAATARTCGSGAPPRPVAAYLALVPFAAVALLLIRRRLRPLRSRPHGAS